MVLFLRMVFVNRNYAAVKKYKRIPFLIEKIKQYFN